MGLGPLGLLANSGDREHLERAVQQEWRLHMLVYLHSLIIHYRRAEILQVTRGMRTRGGYEKGVREEDLLIIHSFFFLPLLFFIDNECSCKDIRARPDHT